MQDDVDEMRKYYSDEVWDAWRHHYEEWPSEAWRALYHDVNALLDRDPEPDPMSAAAQALGERWLALDKAETTVSAIRTGLRRAWLDRDRWPSWLQSRVAEYRVDRATRFVNAVLWERWEAERVERERAGQAAPARVSDARIGLYRACADAVGEDPSGAVAQALVQRWKTILDGDCGSDAEAIREQIDAWRRRRTWTPGMVLRHGRRHLAAGRRFPAIGLRPGVCVHQLNRATFTRILENAALGARPIVSSR